MAITRYRVEAKAMSVDGRDEVIGSSWQYEEVTNPHKNGKILSKEEADKRIKEQGLIQVFSNRHGTIWDKPDEPMWAKYNGTFKHFK